MYCSPGKNEGDEANFSGEKGEHMELFPQPRSHWSSFTTKGPSLFGQCILNVEESSLVPESLNNVRTASNGF